MLQLIDIHKQYEGEPLLCGVSFTVGANETICLLGPSGGGKSTILRIIAGLEEAEAGRVVWDRHDLTQLPAHQRNFGLMFQDYALFPHLNVFENIAFGLRVQKMAEEQISQRVSEVLASVGMRGFAERSVVDLSGGEKQRVAFARAIAPQPRMLMLDEPMGALDRTMRDQLLRELTDLLAITDIPVIYVTHDQEEAYAIADRIMILQDGRIIQSGSPQEVYDRPQTIWVAEFLGQKNILTGTVDATQPLIVSTPIGVLKTKFSGENLNVVEQLELLITDADIDEAGKAGENAFPARVLQCRFLGHGFQVLFEFGNGQVLSAISEHKRTIGQQVSVVIDPGSILCYSQGKLNENCKK